MVSVRMHGRKGGAQMRDLAHMGLWFATLPRPIEPRASLERDERVDVAIVGAGYSGLWTAYYLTALEPGIRVAIVEAEFAGFGASGRNGGWCVGSMAGLDAPRNVGEFLVLALAAPAT